MARSALVLAALLSAAVPGVDPTGAWSPGDGRSAGHDVQDHDLAVVVDDEGRQWEVRAPTTPAGGASLEREAAVLAVLSRLGTLPEPAGTPQPPALGARAGRALLPFAVPGVAGWIDLAEGGRAVVVPRAPGVPLDLAQLAGPDGAALAASLGRALAAVHDLPAALVEDAGAPVHTSAEYRDRRLATLDRAAGTGLVPTALLTRWERGLEDVGRWRFAPAVVHGDLSADDVLVCDTTGPARATGPWASSVCSVVRWGGARVADPADDLAWLVAGADDDAVEVALEAYAGARAGAHDPHLLERARLVSELALAEWLLHGLRSGDQGVVDDARVMLVDLESAVMSGRT